MNEQQKIEELLKPRYEVIGLYPECDRHNIKLGDVLTDPGLNECVRTHDGKPTFGFEWDTFPNIFKPLQWWEKRSVEEMPDYFRIDPLKVRMDEDDKTTVYKANRWEIDSDGYVWRHMWGDHGGSLLDNLLPATESEYTAYINSKK